MMNNKLYLLSTKLISKWDRLNTEININSGVKVNFLVHLQSFAGKIFFHLQTGETTSNYFPLKCHWSYPI